MRGTVAKRLRRAVVGDRSMALPDRRYVAEVRRVHGASTTGGLRNAPGSPRAAYVQAKRDRQR